ncbi:MAG: DUF309 domain-containing protein [Oscillatoriales cyanobacterium SM2_2_1]|nr:DUF309 domain-containing protein [Oscillatoriales cyanobacterium SM2_2_1]
MDDPELALAAAIAQFNRGDYYACHDSLEALWNEALMTDRNFYQGLLQVAVALHHRDRHNVRGAMILLGEGISRLRLYQPEYGGVDTARLVRSAAALLAALQRGEEMGEPLQVLPWDGDFSELGNNGMMEQGIEGLGHESHGVLGDFGGVNATGGR